MGRYEGCAGGVEGDEVIAEDHQLVTAGHPLAGNDLRPRGGTSARLSDELANAAEFLAYGVEPAVVPDDVGGTKVPDAVRVVSEPSPAGPVVGTAPDLPGPGG